MVPAGTAREVTNQHYIYQLLVLIFVSEEVYLSFVFDNILNYFFELLD